MRRLEIKSLNEKSDKLYIKEVAFEIIRDAQSTFRKEINEIKELWDIYNNSFDENKYDYLTSVKAKDKTYKYPARFRNMGAEIVRTKLSVLESEQARRKPRFKAFVSDERSMNKKYEERVSNILDSIEDAVSEKYEQIGSMIQSLNDNMNDLEQRLNVQPENEEIAMQNEQLKQNMPMVKLEFQKAIRELNREQLDMSSIIEKITYYRSFNDTEVIEAIANSFIKGLVSNSDKRDDYNFSFLEKIITGRPAFLVDYNERTKKVDFHRVHSDRAFYSRSSSNKWSDTGEWCATLEYMSYSELLSKYEFTESEVLELKSFVSTAYEEMQSYDNNDSVFSLADSIERLNGGIPVWRVWFMSPREWFWKISPSKFGPDIKYNHMITDKKNIKLKPDDELKRNIVFDRVNAVIIGDNIIKDYGVQSKVYRHSDAPAMPYLPLVCKTFNNKFEKPNSIISKVKNLIELYNIIWYTIELQVVLSGVKGMIMDKSQKPDKMGVDEWIYYRKMGTWWIETMKKGRRVPATFNQFQNYDDTLGDSITVAFSLLTSIDGMIGKSMGITDPRLGQTVAKDPVHNVMLSQEQSSLITEIHYYETDLVYSRALSLYLNLVLKYELSNGKVINHFDEDLQEVLYKIPEGVMNKSDYTIHASNNIQEDHILDIIRNQASSSGMQLHEVIQLYKIDSLSEMEKKLVKIINEKMKAENDSQVNIENAKSQNRQQEIQLQKELESYSQELKNKVDFLKMEIEKYKVDSDIEYKNWEKQFKEKELKAKTDLGLLDISSENQIESAYLQETQRSNLTNEALEQARMRIESYLNIGNMALNKESNDNKKEVDLKKVEADKVRRKNNIKD